MDLSSYTLHERLGFRNCSFPGTLWEDPAVIIMSVITIVTLIIGFRVRGPGFRDSYYQY